MLTLCAGNDPKWTLVACIPLILRNQSGAGREILRYVTWQTEKYKPGREILREYSEDPCTRGLPKYYNIYIVCGKHNQVNYIHCPW
jgi:hypothetical protein